MTNIIINLLGVIVIGGVLGSVLTEIVWKIEDKYGYTSEELEEIEF